MKRKIFLGFGATVLAVAGMLAGRASAKFGTLSTIYYHTTGGCHRQVATSSGIASFATSTGLTSPTQISFQNYNNASTVALYGTSTCATASALYFKP